MCIAGTFHFVEDSLLEPIKETLKLSLGHMRCPHTEFACVFLPGRFLLCCKHCSELIDGSVGSDVLVYCHMMISRR